MKFTPELIVFLAIAALYFIGFVLVILFAGIGAGAIFGLFGLIGILTGGVFLLGFYN